MSATMPTTAERGYGSDHERMRAEWAPRVANGEAWCAQPVCVNPAPPEGTGRWIRPGSAWHLAHSADRTFYFGPAHAQCNAADGGRRSHTARRARRRTAKPAPAATPLYPTSRLW